MGLPPACITALGTATKVNAGISTLSSCLTPQALSAKKIPLVAEETAKAYLQFTYSVISFSRCVTSLVVSLY